MNKFILAIAATAALSLAAPANAAENHPASEQTQLALVWRAQVKLKEVGLYAGEISGFRNNATSRAIRRFQRQNNLPITGTLTPQTVTALGL